MVHPPVLLSLNYPSDIAGAASRLDRILWQLLELCASQHIPHAGEGGSVECVLASPGLPPSLQGRSFQHWLVRKPVRLQGLGLRSLLETSPVALFGGVEMALPQLTGDKAVCPSLETVVGRVGRQARWVEFLLAGTRTAREFQRAWGEVREEVRLMSHMLGKDLEGPLTLPGEECQERSSRRMVTERREELRSEVMEKCLQQHADQQARPVTVFQNFDKLSDPWLQALPGPRSGLSVCGSIGS